MLKSSVEKSKVGDLPCKDVGAKSGSSTEKQRAIDLSHKNSGCLHQSKEEDRIEKAASLLGSIVMTASMSQLRGSLDPSQIELSRRSCFSYTCFQPWLFGRFRLSDECEETDSLDSRATC
ncbi:hypothetical protein L3X38_041998 [Prunus dulcis]|uniref:Uncharacterized protein n=1 Tax=Prunus dulcis TaxID=3755 RepID=A0AAD4UU35_PRUDU|nr:hypothetical protein L3X38_041998 [Prunus dulcis]